MVLLLDTQIAIWSLFNGGRLSIATKREIGLADDLVFSIASVWEVSIKHGLGKLPVSPSIFRLRAEQSGWKLLGISATHCEHLTTLANHHRDPFDRMLVAQAEVENLRLLSADSALEPYGFHVLPV